MADEVNALDSRAVLGLLAKAQQMFTSDDTILSFPIGTPLAFNAEQLVRAMGPAPDAIGHALLAEFSATMNLIPTGPIWPPSNPAGLDDVVREVVNAEWALAERTPAEEARYQEARAQVDLHNPEVAEYASLKDAWIRAREKLANEPDNPVAAELERNANLALVAFPARARIERAMQDLIALDERAPYRTRERFERDIGVGTGTFNNPSGGRFSPVRLLPRAVVTSTGWDAVTLDRAALDELSAGAPPELTSRLIVDHTVEDPIEWISFEYASALLQRTWFDSSMFQLRCWRFADDGRLLSDGQTPPQGECPTYVHAVVLARNVAVTSRIPPTSGGGTDGGGGGGAADFLMPWVADIAAEVFPLPVDSEPIALRAANVFRADQPFVTLVDGHAFADRAVRLNDTVVEADFSRRFVADEVVTAIEPHDAILAEAALAADFELIQVLPDLPLPPPPETPGTVTKRTPVGTVIVLALVCKSVPRTPNPNADAVWE